MYKVEFFCDGCGRSLDQPAVDKCRISAAKHAQGNSGFEHNEVFCSFCLQHADEYWGEKLVVLEEALNQANRRLVSHRNKFFGPKVQKQ